MSRVRFILAAVFVAAIMSSSAAIAQTTNLSIPVHDQTCTRGVYPGFVKALHGDAGGDLDKKAVGGGKEGVGQGPGKMGRLPEAIERSKTQRTEELVVSLPMYDELSLDWFSNVRAWYLNGVTTL